MKIFLFYSRQLQISSFNGKMNALNEVNKVIASVTYYPNRHHGLEEEEYLTPERMAVCYFVFTRTVIIIIIIIYIINLFLKLEMDQRK